MATERKVKTTPTEAYPLGHAKENKDASVYKANGTSVEAGMAPMKSGEYAYTKSAKDAGLTDPVPNGVSYGRSGEPKTEGIVTRGNGAATKGLKARGSMA
jgi:hypothetical protein